MRTHAAQDLVGEQARAGGRHHREGMRSTDVHALAQSRHLLVREELDDGAVDGTVLAEGDPGQTLGANVEATPASLSILARAEHHGATLALIAPSDDETLLVCGGCRTLNRVGKDVGQVDQVHAIAGVGLSEP